MTNQIHEPNVRAQRALDSDESNFESFRRISNLSIVPKSFFCGGKFHTLSLTSQNSPHHSYDEYCLHVREVLRSVDLMQGVAELRVSLLSKTITKKMLFRQVSEVFRRPRASSSLYERKHNEFCKRYNDIVTGSFSSHALALILFLTY